MKMRAFIRTLFIISLSASHFARGQKVAIAVPHRVSYHAVQDSIDFKVGVILFVKWPVRYVRPSFYRILKEIGLKQVENFKTGHFAFLNYESLKGNILLR